MPRVMRPFEVVGSVVQAENNSREVKGFMSVNALDLDEDISCPESFDIDSFMEKGTLLYNHKLWLDDNGNPIEIGKVNMLEVVKLVDHENPEVWGVKSIKTGEVIDTFPKQRVPNLVAGDRGVFTRANVEVEEVWKRVLRRMLNGFSWKGLPHFGKVRIGQSVKKILDKIALSEISLVFTPQQPDAMLVPVMKSAAIDTADLTTGEQTYVIYCFVFSPTVFDLATASQWLKKRAFQFEDNVIVSDDGELVFPQINSELIDQDTSRSMKIARGIQAIIGVPFSEKMKANERDELVALTERMLGCGVSNGNKEEDMLVKKSATDERSTEKVGTKVEVKKETTPDASAVAPAAHDAVVELAKTVGEQPKKVEATAAPVAPVATATVAVTEKIEKPAVESGAPAVKAVEPAAAGTPPVEKTVEVKVETPASPVVSVSPTDETRRPINEAVEQALTNSEVVGKISSLMSQNLMAVVGQKFDELVKGIQGTLVQFTEAAGKLAKLIEAQAEAVTKLQVESPAAPAAAVAKSATEETVAKEVTVEEMQKTIQSLQATVNAMQKTAVTKTIREEPKVKKEEKTNGLGDQVLGKGFLGMKE